MTSFYIISFDIGGAINDLSCKCVRFLDILLFRLKYGFYFYVFSTPGFSYYITFEFCHIFSPFLNVERPLLFPVRGHFGLNPVLNVFFVVDMRCWISRIMDLTEEWNVARIGL